MHEENLDDKNYRYVLDGGSLLHQVPWKTGMLFSEISESYVRYINNRYPNAVIVFDGYASGPSTKDTTHIRRTHGITGAKVYFTLSSPLSTKKETFLKNSENKQNFIFALARELERNGFDVYHAQGDADVLIVKTALQIAETSNVVIVGEDTDLLVIALYHIKSTHKTVVLKPAAKQTTSKVVRIWDIQKAKQVLGGPTRTLPVLHVLSDCDTTSHIIGISKGAALKTFLKNE